MLWIPDLSLSTPSPAGRRINWASSQADGLVSFLPMDDPSIINKDFSKYSVNGSITGSPTILQTERGGMAQFDGLTNYMDLMWPLETSNIRNFTVSFFLKLTTNTNYAIIEIRSSSFAGFVLYYDYNLSKLIFYSNQPTINSYTLYSLSGLYDNKPHLIGCILDNCTMRLYVDGVNQGGELTISSTNYIHNTVRVSRDCTGVKLPGAFRDIRVYNRALSPGEIANIYSNPDSIWQDDDIYLYTQQFKPWFAQPSMTWM
jgi:hypothetical protein